MSSIFISMIMCHSAGRMITAASSTGLCEGFQLQPQTQFHSDLAHGGFGNSLEDIERKILKKILNTK